MQAVSGGYILAYRRYYIGAVLDRHPTVPVHRAALKGMGPSIGLCDNCCLVS